MLSFLLYFPQKFNTQADSDQLPHFAASELCLHYLCNTPKQVSSLKRVKVRVVFSTSSQLSNTSTFTFFLSFIFNPIALRKAKTVYNFGLSQCNRVNSTKSSLGKMEMLKQGFELQI